MQITHSLFADDTLVFCGDSWEKIAHLSWILVRFEAFLGLNINLENSSIMPMGSVEDLEKLALEQGYKAGNLPTTYLGLSLGMCHNSTSVWDGVEERFRKKLASWKRQRISKGGGQTLIRSTLSNLPIYIMSLFRLPKGVKNRLEKIQRDFLWGKAI